MKITNVTKGHCQLLGRDVLAAATEIAKKYGVNVALGHSTYSPGPSGQVCIKIEFSTTQAVERKDSLVSDTLEFHGLKLNGEFVQGSHKFKIVGYNSRASKAPVELQRADGKKFRAAVWMVKTFFTQKS